MDAYIINYVTVANKTEEELRERELKKKVKEVIKWLSASRLCSSLLFGLLNSALLNFVCWNAVHNNEIQLQLNEGDPTKQNIWNIVTQSIQATPFLRSLIYSESLPKWQNPC